MRQGAKNVRHCATNMRHGAKNVRHGAINMWNGSMIPQSPNPPIPLSPIQWNIKALERPTDGPTDKGTNPLLTQCPYPPIPQSPISQSPNPPIPQSPNALIPYSMEYKSLGATNRRTDGQGDGQASKQTNNHFDI